MLTKATDLYHLSIKRIRIPPPSPMTNRVKGTVMQIEKALINDRLRVSKVS